MGLCKCPKKKVTNQFCFQHRVNVCEHCMVEDHPSCTVKSYLQWLNDSDHEEETKCVFCKLALEDAPCIRLICYDVFHTACLDAWGSSLPPHTAPAGYRCPRCRGPVFPGPTHASPVAQALRTALGAFQWALRTQGLAGKESSWDNSKENTEDSGSQSPTPAPTQHHKAPHSTPALPTIDEHPTDNSQSAPLLPPTHRKPPHQDHPHSAVAMATDDESGDSKYKRRPVLVWLRRWWRSHQPFGKVVGRSTASRQMFLFLLVVCLLTVLMLLLSARRGDSDPMFDPLNNPNIHVRD